MSFSSLINNVLGSFANLLTLIVTKYGNIWFNALDLMINTLLHCIISATKVLLVSAGNLPY